jgi:hypothetical protein
MVQVDDQVVDEGRRLSLIKRIEEDKVSRDILKKGTMTSNQLLSIMQTFGMNGVELGAMSNHFKNSESVIPTVHKVISLEEYGEAFLTCSINEHCENYWKGIKIAKKNAKVDGQSFTDAVIDTAVSLFTEKDGLLERNFSTNKLFDYLQMPSRKSEPLATYFIGQKVENKYEAKEALKVSMVEGGLGPVTIYNMAPELSKPSSVALKSTVDVKVGKHTVKRQKLAMIPSVTKDVVVEGKLRDLLIESLNNVPRKNNDYVKIADSHIFGKNLGQEQKYIEFLVDLKPLLDEADVICLHTSDVHYASIVANKYDKFNKDIYMIGIGTGKGRFKMLHDTKMRKVKGLHIFFKVTKSSAKKDKSLFDIAYTADSHEREGTLDYMGTIVRKLSIFSIRPHYYYIPSIAARKFEVWEYIDNTDEALNNFKAEVIKVDEKDENGINENVEEKENLKEKEPLSEDESDGDDDKDDDGSFADAASSNVPQHVVDSDTIKDYYAIYLLHWFLYPWKYNPLIHMRKKYGFVPEISGKYSFGVNKDEIRNLVCNVDNDPEARQFLIDMCCKGFKVDKSVLTALGEEVGTADSLLKNIDAKKKSKKAAVILKKKKKKGKDLKVGESIPKIDISVLGDFNLNNDSETDESASTEDESD